MKPETSTNTTGANRVGSTGGSAITDADRIDWLENEGAIPLLVNGTWQIEWAFEPSEWNNRTSYGPTLRVAIDAAMTWPNGEHEPTRKTDL